MDKSNPETWKCPGWHSDWDGEWQFEQLKLLAVRFLSNHSFNGSVRLEIIDDGYVRVAFHSDKHCLGVAYVNRALPYPDPTPVYVLWLGHEDEEVNTQSIDEAVEQIKAAQGEWISEASS